MYRPDNHIPHRTRDLRVHEASWLLQETENATRRLCEAGAVPAWRVVDSSGNSARFRWNIPSQTLEPLLSGALARRRLAQLVSGEIRAPRPEKRGDPPVPLTRVSPGPSGPASVTESDQRSEDFLSHDRRSSKMPISDSLFGEAR